MKYLRYILIILTPLLLASCQNEGPIGDMYGTWRVEKYIVNGKETTIRYNTSFSFQGQVVEAIAVIDNYGTNWQRFGSWERNDNIIKLNFTHHDNSTSQGNGIYSAPEWLGMTSVEVMAMDCVSDGKKMEWKWSAPDGSQCVYTLHKTW